MRVTWVYITVITQHDMILHYITLRKGPAGGRAPQGLVKAGCATAALTPTIHPSVLTESDARKLLAPFEVELDAFRLAQLLAYLSLLLRWNRRINLTAIRDPAACLTRHFGESLCIQRHFSLRGSLLDIGSGAGFPGLALKLVFPELAVTLLEPVAKKRAFLKEVTRACAFERVEVCDERLENFARRGLNRPFDAATARAVGQLNKLVPQAAACLKPAGNLLLWLSREQARDLGKEHFEWGEPIRLPLSREREIWVGTKRFN